MDDSLIAADLRIANDSRRSVNLVWVHSSFRVSSTWLWSRFRRNPNVVAYYEIFHEGLGSLTPERAVTYCYRHWESGHPPLAPYFLEYAPFLLNGWLRCDSGMAFDSYIPKSADRSISSAEAAHVENLIDKARARRNTPVLTDVRSLGRVHGLRHRFGGFHILVHRNLFRQWCSYSDQELRGNAYFIDQTNRVIEQNTHDAFLSMLSTMFPSASEGRKCSRWEQFIRFTLFHLYVHALALPDCGLCVCVDRLAVDPEYRGDTEEQIAAATGLAVDLTGCHEKIELSALPFDGRQREALETVRVIAGAIPAFLPSWNSHQQCFLDAQICALESELDRYVFYTQATVRYASAGFADLAAAREAALQYADAAGGREDLRQRAEAFDDAATRFEKIAEQSCADAERSGATVGELRTEVRLPQTEWTACEECRDRQLADNGRLRDALTAVHRSTSWRLTAPLRALKRLTTLRTR